MKKFIVTIIALVGFSTFAQQESQFASNFQNPYILNPAAGGITNVMQLDAISRLQWVGAGNGPSTFMFTGHSQIKVGNSGTNEEFNPSGALFAQPKMSVGKMKHIVGGKLMNDAIGVFGKTSIYGSYAIHLPMTKKFNIGAGLGIGFSNFRINQNRVVLFDENDVTYNDALASSSSQNIGDVNAGLVFYGEGLTIGVSGSQVLRNKAKFSNVLTNSNYNRHFFFTVNYDWELENITVQPSVVLKYAENAPWSMDFGSRFLFNQSTWIGFWYRTSNNLVFQVGTTLVKNLYVSYSYEQSIGKIRNAASGTHEVQLGIYLGKSKKDSKASNRDSAE